MTWENENNPSLKCRQLFHQYFVDMYARIVKEQLIFIRLNPNKLCSEANVHLCDAIVNGGNTTNIYVIFLYNQSALYAWVRSRWNTYGFHYSRPDLFITFTYNPACGDKPQLLLPEQLPAERNNISACVFREKLKWLMGFTVKHNLFVFGCCSMYSLEWQNSWLPHSCILM